MRFNLGALTENQDFRMYQLRREGRMRFSLEYTSEKHGWNHNRVIFESNNYDEVIHQLKAHYQNLLAADTSLITDFDTKAFYQIYDFSDHEDYANDVKNLIINVCDLNRLSFMLQFCDFGKQTNKRTKKESSK